MLFYGACDISEIAEGMTNIADPDQTAPVGAV